MGPARTVFIGSGAFALPALARLAGADPPGPRRAEVVTVISAPPRPAGRAGELRRTPVADEALARNLPLLTPASLRDETTISALRATAPDLIVLADFGRMIPAAVLALPRQGALNLHPSLLPRHRGAAPVAAAILAGDEATGVTLMRMDEGLDTGPIIAQRTIPLLGREAAPELEARLAVLAAELLVESLPGWLDGSLTARSQPEDGATLTRPLRRLDGRLRPERPAVELERQVRAYQPWPGSYLERDGERLIVWRAAVEEGPPDGGVGEGALGDLVPVGDSLGLVTGSGVLRLDEVQPAGKRRMPGAEYRRGRRP